MKYLILLIAVWGCDFSPCQYYCSYESQEKRVSFVQKCVKDANPMSDEEPEDMIHACVTATKELYCFWGTLNDAKSHYKKRKESLQEE